MQTFKKNQIIITALVIMIAIAGYLQFTEKDVNNDTTPVINQKEGANNENISTPTALVPNSDETEDVAVNETVNDVANNDATKDNEAAPKEGENATPDANAPKEENKDAETKETASDNENDSSVGEAVFTNSNTVEAGHFLQAKIGREQDYSKAKEGYLALIDNENLKEEQKTDVVKEMIDLHDRIEKEALAESLLEAKGFKDVFVRMHNGEVDVIINAQELSQAESAQVYDIVKRKTGVEPEKITITLLNASQGK